MTPTVTKIVLLAQKKKPATPARDVAAWLDEVQENYGLASRDAAMSEIDNAMRGHRGRPTRAEDDERSENLTALLEQLFPEHEIEDVRRMVPTPRSHVREGITINVTEKTKDMLGEVSELVGLGKKGRGVGPLCRLLMLGGFTAVIAADLVDDDWIEKWAGGQVL